MAKQKQIKGFIKNVIKMPTKRSLWKEFKEFNVNALRGGIVGATQDLGNVFLGDIFGDYIGGAVGIALNRDAEARKTLSLVVGHKMGRRLIE